MILTIKNETFASSELSSTVVEVISDTLSLKELISLKIKKEVDEYNKKLSSGTSNIDVSYFEKKLNTSRKINNKKLLNIDEQINKGIEAFKNKEYFVIVDDRQIEDLEKVVRVKETTAISFLRLTPLIGG